MQPRLSERAAPAEGTCETDSDREQKAPAPRGCLARPSAARAVIPAGADVLRVPER